MPFAFRLEKVLGYRKQLEDQAMQSLAEAQQRLETTRARLTALQADLQEQGAKLARPDALTGPELWLLREYVKALRLDIQQCEALLLRCEQDAAQCRAALVDRAKDKKLLENLKAKQSLRYAEEEKLKEQRDNDETATIRYGKQAG